jgi:hypothetical protein
VYQNKNITKIYEMQHFITLYNVANESFKSFRTNLAWQINRAVTGGGGGDNQSFYGLVDSAMAKASFPGMVSFGRFVPDWGSSSVFMLTIMVNLP